MSNTAHAEIRFDRASTPSPAQGAEEWRKSHTRFSSVERQYYWNDVTVDAYAAHVTAAKDAVLASERRLKYEYKELLKDADAEVERLKRVVADLERKEQALLKLGVSPETNGGGK